MVLITPILRQLAWRLLWVATAGLCALSIGGFLGRVWWFFELMSHFRVQYFFLLAACTLVVLCCKRLILALVPAAFAILNLALLAPIYCQLVQAEGGHKLKALAFNVFSPNTRYADVCDFIRANHPDFAVLIEVTGAWVEGMRPLAAEYPYKLELPHGDNYGIAFYSRIPCESIEEYEAAQDDLPSIVAHLSLDGRRLTIIGTHPCSPRSRQRSESRDRQLAGLAKLAQSQQGEVMLIGDFNTTPWSPAFTDLVRDSGLRDSRQGIGLQPSWPVQFPPLWIPIDHCLVSPSIVIHGRRVGTNLGSDHFPQVVEFSLAAQ